MEPTPAFELFGAAHLVTIAVIAAASVAVPWLARRTAGGRMIRPAAWAIAGALFAVEVAIIVYRARVLGDPWRDNLPLHLCDLGLLIGAVVLVRRDPRLFQLLYYWGLAGTLQAIVTPDIPFGFPDLRYVFFFISHGMVILAIGYAVLALGLLPTLRGTFGALLAANLWALLVAAPVNLLLDTNYLYLCAKPAQASLIDALGPWPWYLLALEAVGMVSFLVVYLPWAVAGRLRARARRVGDVGLV